MDHAAALKLLQTALQHHQAGRLDDAEAIYRRVLAAQPDNVDALHLLGVLVSGRGKADIGLAMLQKAAALMPQFAENQHDLGCVLSALGRHSEALVAYSKAIQLQPRNASFRVDTGSSLLALDRVAEALEQMRIAAQLEPNQAPIVANYGYLLSRAGQYDAAMQTLQRSLQIDPICAPAWAQFAEVLWRAARYMESVAPARRAVELMPNDPRLQLLLGNTLQTAGELEEAAVAYRRSIDLDPNSFDPHNNLALTLLKMGDAREAARMYEEIRARWPQGRDAWANQALALLTLGDFERGFVHYEARMSTTSMEADRRAGRMWDGSDPRGKTFLLASEQGFGDTIQFVRYASMIADRGAIVLVGCPPELVTLVKTVRGITRVIPVGSPAPQYDLIAPMASMPKLFGTTIDSIPANVPYMSADNVRVEQWKARFAGDAHVKVGIAWAGSPAHQNDRARSCKLTDFAPLTAVEGVTFYSLQKGPGAQELESKPADMKITPLGHQLKDFGDTAALLQCLDLLISVDTSVVHLAGALARPVWTLIARGPDWRWMIERKDTPWYPTMRLFRQQMLKQWRPVLERAAEELKKFVVAEEAAKEQPPVILDHLSECEPYRKLGENFIAGFDYLRSTAVESIPDGRYPISGEDVFALVQSYQTKPLPQGRWEAHRHHADIQYIVAGAEQMGIAPLSAMTIQQPYDRDKDVAFFLGNGQFLRMAPGFFTIFYPQDVHMPGLLIDRPAPVKKIVIKVRMS